MPASRQYELTANDTSNLPWISGEFDISGLLRGAPRLLTKEQFVDHLERQLEITRKSMEWRFAVLIVNIESLESLAHARGKNVADDFLRAAAKRVGKTLNPRDAVAIMRDRCFAILLEVPLLRGSMLDFADSVQREVLGLVVEQNARIDPTASVGIAKVRGSYVKGDEVIRDAGRALQAARQSGAGTVTVYNVAMEIPEATIAT